MHRNVFVVTLLAALNVLAADVQQTYPEGTASRSEALSPFLRLDASQLSKLPINMQAAGGSVKLGVAPALTYLEVYAVGSSNQGWEYMSDPNWLSTALDHGGPVLLVAVLEVGYGSNKVAKMNGSLLPSSANYLNESLCWNYYGYLDYCSPGQTVAGFLRYFDLSGYQSGQFTYQNTSVNYGNTMYDSMWIL